MNEQIVDRLVKTNLYALLNFVTTVGDMRQTQKAYFKTKDKALLIRSKELESLVDKELKELIEGGT